MDSGTANPQRRRLTRSEARERTREQLLEAAARVIARKGYAGASVEEIAESAGYSTGALYSNFSGKEQLFLELMRAKRARRITKQAAAIAQLLEEDPPETEDLFAELQRKLDKADRKSPESAALQAEFWLYAVRNPEAMQAVAERTDQRIDMLTPLVTRATQRYAADPGIPPEAVTRIILALYQGLARHRRIDPGAVPADLLTHALRWLFAGMPPANGTCTNEDDH